MSTPTGSVPFGRPMREAHFSFASSYTPLNHGSFGASPSVVRDYQHKLQRETEARPDTFIRFVYPEQLRQARGAIAPFLGADVDEVVFVPNALTGVNTVLRNLTYQDGDVILYFSTIYDACLKTIQSLEETTPARGFGIELTYPLEDADILDMFRAAVLVIQVQGKRVKLAIFDTVISFPGVRFPWEPLVNICRQYGIMSCIDGAHGIGHLDLTRLAQVGPDFFISNCYKWLNVPRGCAVLYVPRRNHHLIRTTYPTAEGYMPAAQRDGASHTEYFVRLFEKVSTVDTTPYICVLEAIKFRERVCGGEKQVQDYCQAVAREGGELMAAMMGTEVLENQTGSLRECCFTNVRLPLEIKQDDVATRESHRGTRDAAGSISPKEAKAVADWITERSVSEFDSFIATRFYAGAFWSRISGQIYLGCGDFEWAANVLLELCARVKEGKWKPASPDSMQRV
ncbi:aminotransferase family protein-like protein [Biscogniauxia marginata]|nr:aminotransferase family protein-like protein [Biscogniauxia marginata]